MTSQALPPFGDLLRQHRLASGLSQEELAERAGISARAISDLERGARHRPYRATVTQLAQALGLSDQERSALQLAARGQALAPAGGAGPASVPGVRTFLIADVRGYTQFTLEQGDAAAAELTTRFAGIVEAIVDAWDGQVIELRGDEALAVFASARQALRAAVELQARLREEAFPLGVGVGVDAGEAVLVGDGYRGAALNLAARLCSLARAGEVLVSESVIHLARKVDGLAYGERGVVQLKGFGEPIKVVEVTDMPDGIHAAEPETLQDRPQRLPVGGFVGSLPAGPLVAREEELSRLLGALEETAAGQGRLVLLAGEPGIGKTRLAQELTLAAHDRGFLVAAGRCYASHQAVPYYPFLEALSQIHAAAPPAIRAESARRWPYLGRLLPNLAGSTSVSSAPSPDEQMRLFWTVTGFCAAVAETRPLALLLDDLHWADQAGLDLLQHLARHTRGACVLLLGTYRVEEVHGSHPLAQVLRDLTREGLVERHLVPRLDREGTERFIDAVLGGGTIPPELTDLVHRSTEGNAFFTKEVLRTLVERGDLGRQNGSWRYAAIEDLAVPETVRAAIEERGARLPEPAQELLRQASVLGQTFTFADLQAMSGCEEDEVEAALDEAAAVGLVRETAPEQYGFDHALTQQALWAQLSGRRRRNLHRAAAAALAQLSPRDQEARAAELAWHFEAGGEPERAVPFAVVAGDQAAAVFAHAQAETQYRRALQLAGSDEPAAPMDAGMEADLLRKLGLAIAMQSRYDEALQVWEGAVRACQAAGDRETERQVVAAMGQAHASKGTPQDGAARINVLLATLTPDDPRDQSSRALYELYEALVFAQFLGGRYEDALRAAERGAHQARLIGDEYARAHAEVYRGSMLVYTGHVVEGTRVTEEAMPALEAGGDSFELSLGQGNLADFYQMRGDLERARAIRERTIGVAERIGERGYLAHFLSFLALDLFYLGDWGQARASCERATTLLRASALERFWCAAYPPLALGTLAVAKGSWEEAAVQLQQAVDIAEPSHDMQALTLALIPLAERDLLEDHPQAAVARLEPTLATGVVAGVQEAGLHVSLLPPLLGRAYLALEQIDRAEEIVADAVSFARRERVDLSLVGALPVLGLVLARQQRTEEANHAFEEAVQVARRMAYGYGEARALYWWSTAGIRGEDPLQTQQHLAQALAIFRRLGAAPYIELTERAGSHAGRARTDA
jgi:class 3 adenylate cyclase/tetratricopeptide (TPR) repeat protein